LSPDKPRKIFTTAEKLGARAVAFVGPDDVKAGRFPMKDLVKGEQAQGSVSDLVSAFQKMMSS
jgi:histidyl-tRNA synthetase